MVILRFLSIEMVFSAGKKSLILSGEFGLLYVTTPIEAPSKKLGRLRRQVFVAPTFMTGSGGG